MRTKQRNLGLTLLSLVMAIALVLGLTTVASTVKADDSVTTVAMQNGARLRVEEDAPALVYTATIENYDSSLEYGMLLVAAADTVGVLDYVAELDAQTYQKVECAPYGTETKKITAYFDIAEDKLTTQFAGIAYIYDGETYVYTEVTNNNIRSVEYVAQMAYLKGDGDKDVLATFISCEISEELYGVNAEQTMNNEAVVDGTNTYLSIVVDNLNEAIDFYDGSTELSFRSSQPYAGGSIVKFDIYVPAEVNGRYWVQFGTTTSKNVVDFYGNPDITEKTAAGAWLTATCQLPEGEDTYYFYITANKGGWNDGADVHYDLRLDNFVITEPNGNTYTQDFENGYNGGDDETTVNFTVRGNEVAGIAPADVVRCVTYGGAITLGGAAPELAMKYVFNVGLDNGISFVSKEAYAGGSELSFYYFIPAGTPTSWWRVSYDTTQEIDFYHSPYLNLGATTGEWTLATVTLPAGGSYYVTITSEVSATNWKIEGENSYALIDNFAVNGEVVENFNHGVARSVFEVRKPVAVMDSADGEGLVIEDSGDESSEHAAKLNYKAWSGTELGIIEFVTKEAYPSGTVITFKYNTVNAPTSYWNNLATCTDPENASVYADASGKANTSKWVHSLADTKGTWVEVTYTLTETAYVHFAANVGSAWADGYMLVDDFSVTVGGNTVTDNFSDGLDKGLFNVNGSGVVELGEGYEENEEPKQFAAKINVDQLSGTAGKFSLMTNEAYPAGSTITFKYKITGNTGGKWWSVIWFTDDNRYSLDVYAHTSGNGVSFDKDENDVWLTKTVTLPAEGGPYKFTFGGAMSEWNGGFLYIDNVVIESNGSILATEGFEDGYGIFFNNLERALTLAEGEGYVESLTGEHALKIYQRDNGGKVPGFFNQAVPGGSTVTFKYLIPEGTTLTKNTWWRISYTPDVPNEAAWTDYYNAAFRDISLVVGTWTTVSITLPTDAESYYVFFATEEGDKWVAPDGSRGYVLVDDFVVTSNEEVVLTENFNEGLDNSILVVRDGSTYALAENEGFGAVVEENPDEEQGGSEPVEPTPEVTFESLVEAGTVLDYVLDSQNRVLWAAHVMLNREGLEASQLLLNVNFDLSYNGTRSFALVLDATSFLYFDGENVSLYQDGELVSTIEGVASNVDIAIRVDGTLFVNANGEYVYMGTLDNNSLGVVGFVSLFGDGTFTVTNLKLASYTAKTQA